MTTRLTLETISTQWKQITGIDPGDRGQVVTKAESYVTNLGHTPEDAWLISFMNWIDGMPWPQEKRQVALGHLQFLEENEKKGMIPFSSDVVGPAFHALLGIVEESDGFSASASDADNAEGESPSLVRSILAIIIAFVVFVLVWSLIYYTFELARIFRKDGNIIQLFFNAMASIGIATYTGLAVAKKAVKHTYLSFVWWVFICILTGGFGIAFFNAWETGSAELLIGVSMQAAAALVGCIFAKRSFK
jgi:hypothetical protein